MNEKLLKGFFYIGLGLGLLGFGVYVIDFKLGLGQRGFFRVGWAFIVVLVGVIGIISIGGGVKLLYDVGDIIAVPAMTTTLIGWGNVLVTLGWIVYALRLFLAGKVLMITGVALLGIGTTLLLTKAGGMKTQY